jgi:hypothetical protein
MSANCFSSPPRGDGSDDLILLAAENTFDQMKCSLSRLAALAEQLEHSPPQNELRSIVKFMQKSLRDAESRLMSISS